MDILREQIKINLLSQNNLAFQIRLTTFLHVLEAYVHSMDYIILCNITTCVCFYLAPLATSSACSDFLRILDRAPNLSILTLSFLKISFWKTIKSNFSAISYRIFMTTNNTAINHCKSCCKVCNQASTLWITKFNFDIVDFRIQLRHNFRI